MPEVPLARARVAPAPLADGASRTRVSAESLAAPSQALAGAGKQVASAAVNLGEVMLREEKKAQQQEAEKAFNDAATQVGLARNQFMAKKGSQLTPEDLEDFNKFAQDTFDKSGSALTAGAAELYQPLARNASRANVLDADKHWVEQNRVVQIETRKASITSAALAAGANPDTELAKTEMSRGLMLIESDGDLTDEQRKLARLGFTTQAVGTGVNTLIGRGELGKAKAYFAQAQKAGMLTPEAATELDGRIKAKSQVADDEAYVSGLIKTTAPKSQQVNLEEVNRMEFDGTAQIQAEVEAGTITAEEGRRRENRFQARVADFRRQRSSEIAVEESRWATAVAGAGTLAAAERAIEEAPEYLRTGLRARAIQAYGDRNMKDQVTLKDPVRINSSEAVFAQGVRDGAYQNKESLVTDAAQAGLPSASADKLVKMFEGKGAINGLTQEDIFAAGRTLGQKWDPKADKDQALTWAIFSEMSKRWPADTTPNQITIREELQKMLWQGRYGDEEGSFINAISAGQEAAFTPGPAVDRASWEEDDIKSVGAEMVAEQNRLKAALDKTKDPKKRADIERQIEALDPSPTKQVTEETTKRRVKRGPDGRPLWSGNSFIFEDMTESRTSTVSAEAAPEEREARYILAKRVGGLFPVGNDGERVLVDRDTFVKTRAAAFADAKQAQAAGNARQLAAEKALRIAVNEARVGDKFGEAAMRVQLDSALAQSSLPNWLSTYLQDNGQYDTFTAELKKSDDPRRLIRTAAENVITNVVR